MSSGGVIILMPICVSFLTSLSILNLQSLKTPTKNKCQSEFAGCDFCDIDARSTTTCLCNSHFVIQQHDNCLCLQNLQTNDISCTCSNTTNHQSISFTDCDFSGKVTTCLKSINTTCIKPKVSCIQLPSTNCDCSCTLDLDLHTTSCQCPDTKTHLSENFNDCQCFVNVDNRLQQFCQCVHHDIEKIYNNNNNNNENRVNNINNNNNQNSDKCGTSNNNNNNQKKDNKNNLIKKDTSPIKKKNNQ